MIARVWRGWTEPGRADEYEALLRTDIFPGILAKRLEGFGQIALLRRALPAETEFVTVMRFSAEADIAAFAGLDRRKAYVPASARRVLARFDEQAAHYEERVALSAGSGAS